MAEPAPLASARDAPRIARLAITATIALAALALLWELALAPLRPGGSWLALKAVPLLVLLPGVMRGSPRALQWLSLVLPFYLAEGVVRGWSEAARHALVAWVAASVAAIALAAVLLWIRGRRRPPGGDSTPDSKPS